MVRSALSKVAWVGRTASMVLGLALVLALVVGAASAAFGANGQAWILGQNNAATAITRLAGAAGVDGPMLAITNNNADANDTALDLRVQSGEAPMRVNSTKKVPNLNADRLDNREASSFADGVGGVATNADKLDGMDSGEFVQNAGQMTFGVFDSWVSSHAPSHPVAVDYRGTWTTFTREANGNTQSEVRLVPPLPSSLYGKGMLLTGVEICYDTSNPAVELDWVKLLRYSSTEGNGSAGGNHVVEDYAPTDGNQCRMYSGTPQLMGTNSFALLEMKVDWSESTSQTSFRIARTTFFLEPSDTAAAPR